MRLKHNDTASHSPSPWQLQDDAEDARSVHRDAPPAERVAFFSREEHATGRRRFGAATPTALWRHYVALPESERHHYELLRDGVPVRLYFDLEFSRAANTGRDGAAMVDALLALLAESLPRRTGAVLGRHIELDSTSDAKFSRHIVCHDVVFVSATAAGAFVRAFWDEDVAARREVDPRAALLFVRKEEDGTDALTPFVDLGVYTRNRAFRLYLSSKAGKAARLLPTRRCWEALHASGVAPPLADDAMLARPQRWLFFEALVCEVAPCALLLGDAGAPGAQPFAARTPAARGERVVAGGSSADVPCPLAATAVCAFAAACDGSAPYVRTWAAFPTHGLLVLNLARTRWCGNVGRSHKSNGVFYMVDLRDGCFYQKCHDPDCRAYRSPPETLPPEARGERAALHAVTGCSGDAPVFAAEDAWLESLSATELAALDGACGDAPGDDSWWAQLQPRDWAALDADCVQHLADAATSARLAPGDK